jgi:UDP-GlcNAc:undecaprenyl-phosphate GlcNAc-1-phosphate transferase
LLGGIAILVAVSLAAAFELPGTSTTHAILGGAAVITLVGALDDRFDLPPGVKFLGQVGAALIPVLSGVVVTDFTLPFLGHVDLGDAAKPLTLLGLVFLMNVVNFSDGVDGLAAGVCTISALAFSIIAFDLGQNAAAILAAATAGAALGFLFFNFNPASIFMGDSGANLLGYLLGCVAVQGTLKTNAVIALVFPLVILAVPFVDTTFVVLKRIKYRKPVYSADRWHLHHRMANIGFSQRRTVLYLYGWTLIMAGLAVALRFIPYSDDHGHLHAGWSILMGALGLIALAASIYLVYVLEIVKFRRLRGFQLRRVDPETSEHQIEAEVQRELETGEFEAVEAKR